MLCELTVLSNKKDCVLAFDIVCIQVNSLVILSTTFYHSMRPIRMSVHAKETTTSLCNLSYASV